MDKLGWIVLGIALAAIGGYVIYRLWAREQTRAISESIRAEVDRVRSGGIAGANSFAPAALAGARTTLVVPGAES